MADKEKMYNRFQIAVLKKLLAGQTVTLDPVQPEKDPGSITFGIDGGTVWLTIPEYRLRLNLDECQTACFIPDSGPAKVPLRFTEKMLRRGLEWYYELSDPEGELYYVCAGDFDRYFPGCQELYLTDDHSGAEVRVGGTGVGGFRVLRGA